jgi:hypothetical protein
MRPKRYRSRRWEQSAACVVVELLARLLPRRLLSRHDQQTVRLRRS